MVESLEKEESLGDELEDKMPDDLQNMDTLPLTKQDTKTKKSLLRGSVSMDKNELKNKMRLQKLQKLKTQKENDTKNRSGI